MSDNTTPPNQSNDQIKSLLLRSTNDIADLFKSISNSKRLQILAFLLGGRIPFNELMKQTELSKTALANHITQLVEKGLIVKFERGLYTLSENGRQLLLAASIFYKDIQQKGMMDLEKMQQYYSEGYQRFQNSPETSQFMVNPAPKYQGCWISFLGAVAGVLKSFGTEYDFDIIDVAGYSGIGFLMNMCKGKICASGPTALGCWNVILDSISLLGWKMERWGDFFSYPSISLSPVTTNRTQDSLTLYERLPSEDKDRAKKMFDKVKDELLIHNRAVIMWGLNLPEYGIVKGFDVDSYLVSTYRWLIRDEDKPIKYWELNSPGSLSAYFFRKISPWSIETLCSPKFDKEVLVRALKFARGEGVTLPGYVTGILALDEWIIRLSQDTLLLSEYHGNSYCASCYQEARGSAAVFLSRMSVHYVGTSKGKIFSELIVAYQHEEKYWREFTSLFPFGFSGDFSKEKRYQGTELLKIIKEYEIEAIKKLEKLVALFE